MVWRNFLRGGLLGFFLLYASALARVEAGKTVATVDFDPRVQTMVNEVSEANLREFVGALADLVSRDVLTEQILLAEQYITQRFLALRAPTDLDAFEMATYGYPPTITVNNVVATLPGCVQPERVVVLGAHFDSLNLHGQYACPGADDNASGTAAVIEGLRVMAPYDFAYTLRFVAFNAEEYGLFGSAHYAAEALARNEEIVGVINMDQIGCVRLSVAERLYVFTNADSNWLAEYMMECSGLYANTSRMIYLAPAEQRDQDAVPFWDLGYSAVSGVGQSPNHHTINDTIATLHFSYFKILAKACLATAAQLAQPQGFHGDLDRDGQVTAGDSLLLAGFLAENFVATPAGLAAVDIDRDGGVDARDALSLQLLLVQ